MAEVVRAVCLFFKGTRSDQSTQRESNGSDRQGLPGIAHFFAVLVTGRPDAFVSNKIQQSFIESRELIDGSCTVRINRNENFALS